MCGVIGSPQIPLSKVAASLSTAAWKELPPELRALLMELLLSSTAVQLLGADGELPAASGGGVNPAPSSACAAVHWAGCSAAAAACTGTVKQQLTFSRTGNGWFTS
eukprot:gene16865-28412_t